MQNLVLRCEFAEDVMNGLLKEERGLLILMRFERRVSGDSQGGTQRDTQSNTDMVQPI